MIKPILTLDRYAEVEEAVAHKKAKAQLSKFKKNYWKRG